MGEKKMELTEHLNELRKVIVVCIIMVFITSTASYYFLGDWLVNFVSHPLEVLNVKIVYIGIGEAFITKIKLSALSGIIMALPVIIYQVWSFIATGLFPKERNVVLKFMFPSIILFFFGVTFAYFIVFNYATRFLLMVAAGDLTPMLSVGPYVSFLITFLVPFGIMFELPLAVYFLAGIGIVNYRLLVSKRKYAILLFFVLAAVLTPGPDLVSQIFLALPMVILYEISVLITRLVRPNKQVLNC
jgi:sec-independent protein translocase protein TatC